MLSKILNATLTGSNGLTAKWIVTGVSGDCGIFYEGLQLGATIPITGDPFDISYTIQYEETCTALQVSLVVFDENNECSVLYFDVLNDDVETNYHFECIADEIDAFSCQLMPGAPEGANQYSSLQECLLCTTCPCATNNPCDEYGFMVEYICPPEDTPGVPGTLRVTFLGIEPDGTNPITPVILQHIIINWVVAISGLNYQFTAVNEIWEYPYFLPAGSYNITPVLGFGADCTLQADSVSVNCAGGPPPPGVETDLFCCQLAGEYDSGGSWDNVGGLNAYVLDYSAITDLNQDIVIDFGTNQVADKIEVYKGVVTAAEVFLDTLEVRQKLIGFTPYIGDLNNCRNFTTGAWPNCFVPAVGTSAESRNTVAQGIKEYRNLTLSGGYNQIATYSNRTQFTNPPWATELAGSGGTHNVNTGQSIPGNGGPNAGLARLRISDYDVDNPEHVITVVVHNNGSQDYSNGITCPPTCNNNNTAWKFYVHCPDCPSCDPQIDPLVTCDSSFGSVRVDISVDTIVSGADGIEIKITPALYGTPDEYDIADLYVFYSGTGLYYQVSLVEVGSLRYFKVVIPPGTDIAEGEYIEFFYDSNNLLTDVINDTYTISINNYEGCQATGSAFVQCQCFATYTLIGNTEICEEEDLYITVALENTTCEASSGSLLNVTISPPAAWLVFTTDPLNPNNFVIYNIDNPVPGTYDITFVYDCNDGCFINNEGSAINITVKEFNCTVSANITNTTCGNSNGEIALKICPGATVYWQDNIANTNTTRTGLAAGTYIAVVTDSEGCTNSFPYEIDDLAGLVLTKSNDTIPCGETVMDQIALEVSGGNDPYDITLYRHDGSTWQNVWDDTNYVSLTPVLTAGVSGGLSAGYYKFSIVDDDGCIKEITFYIVNTPVVPILTSNTSSTCGDSNGSIRVSLLNTYDPDFHEIYYIDSGEIIDTCQDTVSGGNLVLWTESMQTSPGYVEISNLTGNNNYTVCVIDNRDDCCSCNFITINNVNNAVTPPTVTPTTICVNSLVNLNTLVSCSGGVPTFYANDCETLVGCVSPGCVVQPTNTTTYCVKCETASCESASESLTITTVNPPFATVPQKNAYYKCRNSLTGTIVGTCTGSSSEWLYPTNTGTASVAGNVFNFNLLNGLTASTVYLTYKCYGSANCVTQINVTVVLLDTVPFTTQNLTFCPNQSITQAAQLNGAIVNPVGYSCGSITYYTNNTCTTPRTFPFNGPAAGQSVTLYAKGTCTPLEGGTGCSTSCIPFTITGAASQVLTPSSSLTCNSNVYTLTVNSNTGGSISQHIWQVNGVLNGQTGSSLTISPITPGSYTINVVYTGGSCPASGSITVTVPQIPTIVIPEIPDACVGTLMSSVTVSSTNGSTPTITVNPVGGASISGNIVQPISNVAGTYTITATTSNAAGCVTTDTEQFTISSCDPCIEGACQINLTNLATSDSTLHFDGVSIGTPVATTPTSFVIAVRLATDSLATPPIAYITSSGYSGPFSFLGITTIDVTTPGWVLPLPVNTYKLTVESISNNIVCNVVGCSRVVTIECADCTLLADFEATIYEDNTTVFQLCLPCNTNCFKLFVNSGPEYPDSIEIATDPEFTNIIFDQTFTTTYNTQVLYLSGNTWPYLGGYQYSISEAVSCTGTPPKKVLYLRVNTSVASGDEVLTNWLISTNCCNCLVGYCPIEYPCITDAVYDDVMVPTKVDLSVSTLSQSYTNSYCTDDCTSTCDNYNYNLPSISAFKLNRCYSTYNDGLETTYSLGECALNVTCTSFYPAIPYCPQTGSTYKELSGTMSTTWSPGLQFGLGTYTMSFTNTTDKDNMLTWINKAVETGICTAGNYLNKIVLSSNSNGTSNTCGDVNYTTLLSGLITMVCDNNVCTPVVSITDNATQIFIEFIKTELEVRALVANICSDTYVSFSTPTEVTGRKLIKGSGNGETIIIRYGLATTVYARGRFGRAIEECRTVGTFVVGLLDITDITSWALGLTKQLWACETTYGIIDNSTKTKIIQISSELGIAPGDTGALNAYITGLGANLGIHFGAAGTVSAQADFTVGANNCFTE